MEDVPSVFRVLSPGFLKRRPMPLRPEWMDAPDPDPKQLSLSLLYLRRINKLLQYNRTTLRHLGRFSRGWPAGQRIDVLDVATGSADVPRAIVRWGRANGFDIHATGVDLHPVTAQSGIRLASTQPAYAAVADRVTIARADARSLPFADRSFDYVTTSLFLHHLENDQIPGVLSEIGRVCRRGVILSDLLRRRRAYTWITLMSALANPMVRHDARLSVAQGFSEGEILAMRDRAGLQFATYHEDFGHRFVLAGERL